VTFAVLASGQTIGRICNPLRISTEPDVKSGPMWSASAGTYKLPNHLLWLPNINIPIG